jgi:hypothetical protein
MEIKINLPEDLAREAEDSGLLTSEVIESLLRSEIRRRRVDRLFEAAGRPASSNSPPLTAAEVEAEIQAVREKKRTPHARGG